MKRGLFTAAALLAVVVLALPWVLGTKTQRVYETALARMQEQGMRVIDNRYRRGWLSSEASVRIGLPPGAGRPIGASATPVQIKSRIDHGPWGLGSTRLPPSAALIESRVELPVPWLESSPLLLRTSVELDGSGTTEMRTPAVWLVSESADLQTGEGRGELKFAARFANVEARFELPSVSLSIPGGIRFDLRDLRVRAEGARWIGALYTGDGTVSLERAELRAPDASLLAQGLVATGMTTSDDGLLSMELTQRVDELSVNGAAYGPSQVSFSLRRLPGDALASFQQAMQELSAGALDRTLTVVAMAAILVEHLPSLLAEDPRLALKEVEISTPEGRIRGRLSLGTQGLTRQTLERPGAWLEHLAGECDLSVPRPLLLRLLEGWQRSQLLETVPWSRQQTPVLPAMLDAEIATAARDRLDVLVRQGWLVEEVGGLRTNAMLADALLTVNGKTIPVGTLTAH